MIPQHSMKKNDIEQNIISAFFSVMNSFQKFNCSVVVVVVVVVIVVGSDV